MGGIQQSAGVDAWPTGPLAQWPTEVGRVARCDWRREVTQGLKNRKKGGCGGLVTT